MFTSLALTTFHYFSYLFLETHNFSCFTSYKLPYSIWDSFLLETIWVRGKALLLFLPLLESKFQIYCWVAGRAGREVYNAPWLLHCLPGSPPTGGWSAVSLIYWQLGTGWKINMKHAYMCGALNYEMTLWGTWYWGKMSEDSNGILHFKPYETILHIPGSHGTPILPHKLRPYLDFQNPP